MTLMGAFGCLLIAFGPIGTLFCLTIARDPLQVIFFTLSAFFWLVGLLFASLIWWAVIPLRDHLAFGLIIACFLQDAMRFLFYLLVSKAESGLYKMVEKDAQDSNHSTSTVEVDVAVRCVNDNTKHGSIFDFRTLAFTSGLSFALMGCITEYFYIFSDVIGPGTLLKGSSPMCFFIFAGLNTCFMGLLQVSWSVILFRAFRLRLYMDIVVVLAIHSAISLMTLLNEWPYPAPELVCVVIVMAALGFYIYAFFRRWGRLPFGTCSSPRSIDSQIFTAPSNTATTAIT